MKLKLQLEIFQQTSSGPNGFMCESNQAFREELTLIHSSFSNSSKKFQRKEHSHSHPVRPPSPLYQNYDISHTKRKLWTNITEEEQCRNPQQNKHNPTAHKNDHTS